MARLMATDFPERSPLYTIYDTAELITLGSKCHVARYGEVDELAQLQLGGLVDLSNLPRAGFRGTQAAQYLEEKGYTLPQRPNQAVVQPGGELILRLSQTEYFLLGSLADGGARIEQEEAAWSLSDSACYLLPRQDSHAWLVMTGAHCPDVMAKVCGVDLGESAFPAGSVAQTSVARINCIVVNVAGQTPRLQILCDRASAHYLWHALLDAFNEFGGKAVGIEALQRLS